MNVATPRIAASRRSNPKDLDKVRTEFDRLTRRRLGALLFGAVAVRGTRSHSPLQIDFSCVIPFSAKVRPRFGQFCSVVATLSQFLQSSFAVNSGIGAQAAALGIAF
jgi:hypothetical protein